MPSDRRQVLEGLDLLNVSLVEDPVNPQATVGQPEVEDG